MFSAVVRKRLELQLLGVGASLGFLLMRCRLYLQMRSARQQTAPPPDSLLMARRLHVIPDFGSVIFFPLICCNHFIGSRLEMNELPPDHTG